MINRAEFLEALIGYSLALTGILAVIAANLFLLDYILGVIFR